MTTETTPLDEKIYCSGCGHFIQDEIKKPAFACCPDSDYHDVKIWDIKTAVQNFKEEFGFDIFKKIEVEDEKNSTLTNYITKEITIEEALIKHFGKSLVETIPNYTNEETNNSFSDKTILQETSNQSQEKKAFGSMTHLKETLGNNQETSKEHEKEVKRT